jgi:hypothetical protein
MNNIHQQITLLLKNKSQADGTEMPVLQQADGR